MADGQGYDEKKRFELKTFIIFRHGRRKPSISSFFVENSVMRDLIQTSERVENLDEGSTINHLGEEGD